MKKMLFVFILLILLIVNCSYALALNVNLIEGIEGERNADVEKAFQNLWSTIAMIVQILAVAAVVFAGLRYMFSSADQRADIKKSLGILVIGAVLVFGAILILQLIEGATSNIINI